MFQMHWRRPLFLWLMAALSIALFVLARVAAAGLSPAADAEIILAGDDTVTEDTALEMRRLEKQQNTPLAFTLWEEEKDALAENAAWNRQTKVSVLLLNGDSDLLFGGPVLKKDDTDGCLIDTATAEALFGSRNVVGSALQYAGRTWIIRGILSDMTPVLVVQAAALCHDSDGSAISGSLNSGAVAFHHLSLRFPSTGALHCPSGGDSANRQGNTGQIDEFLIRYGLTGVISRPDKVAGIAEAFSFLLPAVLWGRLLGQVLSLMRQNRRYPVRVLLAALLLPFLVWLFFCLTGLHPHIPEDMIPTRWSDFSFWSRWMKTQTENFTTFLSMEKSPMDLQRLRLMGIAVAAGIGSVLSYFQTENICKTSA